MKSKTRKILAMVLSIVLAVSLLPTAALAAGSGTTGGTDGLELTKVVSDTPDADGVYWLTLQAYTTGTVTTTTSAKPTDIVILLDQSGSMQDSLGADSRQLAMKDAVKNFINSVAEKYSATANHRIGIVTFGSSASTLVGMTEVNTTGASTLTTAINNLTNNPEGATRIDLGMTGVSSLMPAADASRDRLVIVFTDGVPTESRSFNVTVANSALSSAKTLKDAGVKVHTVGIFSGADTAQLYGSAYYSRSMSGGTTSVPCTGEVDSSWGGWGYENFDVPATNRFLNYLSSNSATATAIGLEGIYNGPGRVGWKITANATCDTTKGNYHTASNTAELNNVFASISNSIATPTISLKADAIVRDIIADPFELKVDSTHQVSVSKVNYAGNNTWATSGTDITSSVTVNAATTGVVDVSGFDFDSNVVYDNTSNNTFGGAKLVIRIPIVLKDGATLPAGVTASNVPTNGSGSGIVSGGDTVETFPVPDVALYTVTFKDWNTATLKTQLVSPNGSATAPADPSRTDYVFTGWDKAFTNVSSDLTVTATYAEDKNNNGIDDSTESHFTVTYAQGDHGTLAGADSEGKVVHSNILTGLATPAAPTVTPAAGYIFKAWTPTVASTVTANVTYTATYAEDKNNNGIDDSTEDHFTVTYAQGDHGTLAGADSEGKVVHSNILTGLATPAAPTVTPAAGYIFKAWTPTVASTVTANVTYTATYAEDKNNNGIDDSTEDHFTVTYAQGDHGTLAGADSEGKVVHTNILTGLATPAAPTVTPAAGYIFKEWTPTVASTVTANVTYTATYAEDKNNNGIDDSTEDHFTVTYAQGDHGTLAGADSEGKVVHTNILTGLATPAAPTVTPAAGYIFKEWTPTVASTVTANVTYTATYAEDKNNNGIDDSTEDHFTVTFKTSANGTINGGTTDVTVTNVLTGTAWSDSWVPTAKANAGYKLGNPVWDASFPATITANVTFTLKTELNGGILPIVPVDPAGDITDAELNRDDHYAYIVGYPDGTVRPGASITRAEVATIFFRMLTDTSRQKYWSQTNDFSDVTSDAWYNNAVSTLTKSGVISGYPDGTFKPNASITRAEFATIAARFYSANDVTDTDAFTDISGHWANDNINKASKIGIVSGYPDGSFRPDSNITRAEAMTLMNNVLGRAPSKDHFLENMAVWTDNMDTGAWYYAAVQEATNSHDCEMSEDGTYEIWTVLQTNRDWSALEKEWADAYAGN